MLASGQGNERIVSALLDHGANVNARAHGLSPLLVAVDNQNTRVANLLISRGADIERKGGSGRTALIQSATRQDPRMMELLLGRGAKVNARDEQGYTPLFLASTYGFVPHVKLLIQYGADVSQADNYGATPLNATILSARNYRSAGIKVETANLE